MSSQNPPPPEGKRGSSKTKGCLIALAVIVLLVIIVSKLDKTPSPKTAETIRTPDSTQEPQKPQVIVEADYLRLEYEENEVAADNKYKGSVIVVTGSIRDIGKDILDDAYVVIGGSGFMDGVQCMFQKNNQAIVATLSKGQEVRIRGKVSGKLGNILLRDCHLQ